MSECCDEVQQNTGADTETRFHTHIPLHLSCRRSGLRPVFDKSADFFYKKVWGQVGDLLDISRHVEVNLAGPRPGLGLFCQKAR